MLDRLTDSLDFHSKALVLRSQRQQTIASNIANADTPGYAGREMNFGDALRDATGGGSSPALAGKTYSTAGAASADGRTDGRHFALPTIGAGRIGGGGGIDGDGGAYTVQTQPTLDGNSVDLDRERAAFADNAVRYEATLRFINGQSKTMLAAITGQ
ncbi:Flagellar basal body rod protein FlgB [Burkholderiales bacterium 8X]|nr:Flagellar basal body rod protein FlgB [Burkholderiales bacterium 8X]